MLSPTIFWPHRYQPEFAFSPRENKGLPILEKGKLIDQFANLNSRSFQEMLQKPIDFQRFWFAERLEACIDRQPVILRRCCGRRMLEQAEFCVSLNELWQKRRATGCDFCDFIFIELASFVDIVPHRFPDLVRILDEFERFPIAPQSVLCFVGITPKPEFRNLVQQK